MENRGMAPPATSPRPIGFWLRRADEAITRYSDRALGTLGLTRLQWQVLHSIHEADTATLQSLGESLRNFAEESALQQLLAGFEAEGWLARGASAGTATLTLTEKGRAGYAAALEIQTAVRQRLMDGISAEEYATVLRVLERMVRNLD